MAMQVHIISREMVKPSSPEIKHRKPYKLSYFDQLTPTTYAPAIYFYSVTNFPQSTLPSTLKQSLVKALNLYYPLSGRVNENLYIDRFDEGLPFFEVKVNCSISSFLKHYENEPSVLNCLLPCQPFGKETNMNVPVVAFQVSLFTCGGIALGWVFSHKVLDLATASSFISTWASIFRGDFKDVIEPDLEQASVYFPSRSSIPQNHVSLMENLWFVEANYITRRFVFDAKAIAALKAKAKGKLEAEPSRVETLTCFIWKCCMAASKAISATPKVSILVEAVNLRPNANPPMKDTSTGNLFWWASAVTSPTDENSTEMDELVSMLREAIALYKSEYTHSLQGENGFETMSEFCEQLYEILSKEGPDIFAFTSWCNSAVTRPNFGFGEPYWVGIMGKPGNAFRNLTVFVDAKDGKGIEAWITLDKERMAILQQDPEFLAFASSNARISSL